MTESLLDQAVAASASIELSHVPASVLTHAGHVIADTIGVSHGGAREPEFARLVELARAEGTIGDAADAGAQGVLKNLRSSTVFSDSRYNYASAEYAAYLNASAGSFLEMDEGVRPTGHPGMHVVSAAVATAERIGASGAELLQAVIAGYETTSRIFRAFRLRYPVHPHGHVGTVGAAVAVALLKGIDPIAAARVAATSPLLTIWDACYDGATARNTWMGQGAAAAVRASVLVEAGFTGSARAFEVAFSEVGGELIDADAMTAPLSYDLLGITRNYFKLHSACALTHPALDAVFKMDLPKVDQIDRILVETVSNNMKLNRQPQPNSLSGRFSLPYAVATGVMIGRSDPDAFTFKPEVAELAQRVEIRNTDEMEARWPDASATRVTVFSGGQSMSAEVDNPHGHFTEPVTGDELKEKFVTLVREPDQASQLWNKLTSLVSVDDCATLFKRTAV